MKKRLLACLVALSSAACVTAQGQGDRAYENNQCEAALDFYDKAADEEGVDDPIMYHRAARCAVKVADFAAAERYYARSLRNGGSIEVARELADFYISTNNFASAVPVYQYLLHHDSQKRKVYNNLGTALMYAGRPFDAESYLMIAQQLDPREPTAYLNLGLLYDRHLKQPWLAINFYDCYASLSGGRTADAPRVRQRAVELRERYHKLYDEAAVSCGEEYAPRVAATPPPAVNDAPAQTAAQAMAESSAEAAANAVAMKVEPQEPANTGPPVIESQVSDDPPRPVSRALPTLERARLAYEQLRYAEAVGIYAALPMVSLEAIDKKYLGLAYRKQANWSMASHWLEMSLAQKDDPEIIEALFEVYANTSDQSGKERLCRRYRNDAEYEKLVAKRCKSAEKTEDARHAEAETMAR